MERLKSLFQQKAIILGNEIKEILRDHGDKIIDESTIGKIYGGMRGLKSMIYETSALDPSEGIRFRGFSIPELEEKLPSAKDGNEPLPEGLFWLMLTGELPTEDDVAWLTEEWRKRANFPQYVKDVLDTLPLETHPMTMLSIGILAMRNNSIFDKKYSEGMNKSEYWDATYEDSMNLIANLPYLGAYIYNIKYNNGKQISSDPELDWGANYAHMMGNDDEGFKELMRLYLTIHADHEGGNASAHTTHLVNSTLSDAYFSLSAGINALAGPLHGLANQEVIKWVFEMIDDIGTDKPTDEQIIQYIHKTIEAGRVIPGYGHAVLRIPDPRFTAQQKFAERNIENSNLINIIWKLFEHIPPILTGLGKVKNPFPNVDAHSGALLVHYGFKEYDYYTVMFGVSRALGVLAASVWSRALNFPLERPKSLTTDWIKNFVKVFKQEPA
ncbi:MAG: citrate (Si)-synthase [Saprospiraceae bacterium]|nr:citrate (Si)-synthase [Saprospiraceae bacterium]